MKAIFKKLGITTKEYDSEIVVTPCAIEKKCQVASFVYPSRILHKNLEKCFSSWWLRW